MSKKKDPKDYRYGKPCEDHLGNTFHTAKEMSIHYGIPYETYQSRKRRGWDIERILTTPVKSYTSRNAYRSMDIPLTETEQWMYDDHGEIPGSRIELMVKQRWAMERQEK